MSMSSETGNGVYDYVGRHRLIALLDMEKPENGVDIQRGVGEGWDMAGINA